ncbi:MAG: nucleotidyl transferase AbiEii/AbiGii toxin family protein [Deltaproteobacteria bacterium]|nr:nucleotidyl transferase AbiEii/AbiGii toxin family protein [Deltaproteobacteria bacterium]MBW2533364.1 nucleotidyl transferase AbiEii/AbiGii toxin family protein [Deltaproteobacteria bacterium]
MARLKAAGLLDGLFLAGGSAVAHHLAHRVSNDLDLFSPDQGFDVDQLRRRASATIDAEVIAQSDATLKLRLSGAVVDFVRYPYPSLGRPLRGIEGVRVASLRDLATMKLAAITKRGVRRDYWDLHEILTSTRLTLAGACRDYVRKYGVSESDIYHVLRALSWFEDAEADPSHPRGLTRKKWREIRDWFALRAARELVRQTRS